MSDIFVSYASEDRDRVKSLAQALKRKGWSVWWDRRIPIGRSFDEVIEEALDASKAVVVVWSQTSVKSQWVKNEAREGLRRRVLFPVMLLEEVRIPLEFRDVQTAHLMDWQPEQEHHGFAQFLDDLAQVIGAPAKVTELFTLSTGQPSQIKVSQEPASASTSKKIVSSSLPGLAAQAELVSDAHGANNLSALTVSSGSLSPRFSANTLNYTVNVASDVASVTVSATKADLSALISGDVSASVGVATGQRTIQLSGPGTTTGVTIWVTALGGSQKTYIVNVFRVAKVEAEPGQLEPLRERGGAGYSELPSESQVAPDISGGNHESAQSGEDRLSKSAGTGRSTDSFPYLPIGIGLLAVIGVFVYFLIAREFPTWEGGGESRAPS
ncbi:MAG: TIR domain-containing protein, partial [Nitrospira sp.]|nr:TIR domain-containing protein [Nitrospira sp.]